MPLAMRVLQWLPLACVLCACAPLHAQLPFYTDDTGVTEPGKWHFEFFNEYDALQLQYPNLRQNTANFKLNYGLPHHLELDVDVPFLVIDRAASSVLQRHWGYGYGDQVALPSRIDAEFQVLPAPFILNSRRGMNASNSARA